MDTRPACIIHFFSRLPLSHLSDAIVHPSMNDGILGPGSNADNYKQAQGRANIRTSGEQMRPRRRRRSSLYIGVASADCAAVNHLPPCFIWGQSLALRFPVMSDSGNTRAYFKTAGFCSSLNAKMVCQPAVEGRAHPPCSSRRVYACMSYIFTLLAFTDRPVSL